jgi:hypothetical protein
VAYNLLLLALFVVCDLVINLSQVAALLPWRNHHDAGSKKNKGESFYLVLPGSPFFTRSQSYDCDLQRQRRKNLQRLE